MAYGYGLEGGPVVFLYFEGLGGWWILFGWMVVRVREWQCEGC